MFGATLAVFVVLLPWRGEIFTMVARPLMEVLPEGKMIATDVASTFLTPVKMAFFAALFIAMPVVLYQIWAFVAPGLYRKEKRFAFPLLASSIALFYFGIAFAYYVVFPLIFKFFVGEAPELVEAQTDIAKFLDFIITIVFAFGLAFEVPIATVLVVWTGLTSPAETLGRQTVRLSWCIRHRHVPDATGRDQPDVTGSTHLYPVRAWHRDGESLFGTRPGAGRRRSGRRLKRFGIRAGLDRALLRLR